MIHPEIEQMKKQQELDQTLQRMAEKQRSRVQQNTPNPMYKERIYDMLRQAKADGRELHLSDISDPDLQRWVAGKLAVQRKPKSKIPGKKRRKMENVRNKEAKC